MILYCQNCNQKLEDQVRCSCGHRNVVQEDPRVVRDYLVKAKKILTAEKDEDRESPK